MSTSPIAPSSVRPPEAQRSAPPCPACAGTARQLVYRKWGYPILRCRGCGLGWAEVDPAFDPQHFYGEGYFQGALRDGYADYVGSEPVLRGEFRRAVAHLRRFAPSGRLLEVGCAYGFFLLEAQAHFHATGIDVAQSGIEFARRRGLDAHCETPSGEFLRRQGPLDAVVMLDVIEHLADPAAALGLLHAAMVPGAALMISTGDWESLVARLTGRHWRLMTPPQHLFYFSRRSLSALLRRSGFRIVDCARPAKRVPLQLAAYQLEQRLGFRLPLGRWLGRAGLPLNLFDALRVVARRLP